jgi:hypothetical protein
MEGKTPLEIFDLYTLSSSKQTKISVYKKGKRNEREARKSTYKLKIF